MTKRTFKHNPWLIPTGSAILGVIGIRLIDYVTGTTIIASVLKLIKTVFVTIGNIFIIKFEVSLWFLISLPIIVIGLIIFILGIISLFQNDKNTAIIQQAPFLTYKEDVFGEVLFRWEYLKNYSDKYEISNISHYCPGCKCLIVYNSCPICHKSFYTIKTDYEVNALIRHKIETQISN